MEYKSEATGARIVINPCSFMEAFKLKSLIEKALLSTGKSVEELIDLDVTGIVFLIDSSEEVMMCLFDCLKRSLYDDKAIKPELFDDVKAREDLYEIFFNCMKVNLHPFLKQVLSKLQINVQMENLKGILTPKSKTNSDSSAALLQGKGISVETPKE